MKKGPRPNLALKERINKLVQAGFSYPEVADTVGLKSRQAARYHFTTYRKQWISKGIDK